VACTGNLDGPYEEADAAQPGGDAAHASDGSLAVDGEPGALDGGTVDGSTTDSGTTETAPMPYPAHVVAVYHMMWPESGSPPLADAPANVNVVNLAFGQGDPPVLVGWTTQGEAEFVADASELRAVGVRIVLSVGGAGGDVNVSHRQDFVDGVMAINEHIPLDGLDWDLEGPAMTTDDVVWISSELKNARGADFAITLAPNGSNVDHYIDVAVALESAGALDAIGQQFYDAVVSREAALGRIEQMLGAGIPEGKITIGMMVGDADTYWTVAECVDAVTYLLGAHPGLRGGYLWEDGRPGTAEWADQVGGLFL